MFKKILNRKGYTLVELILTLAIIGIMIAPIYNAFLEANRVNLRSKRQVSAAYLAQNVMEEIKGQTLADFITEYGASYNADSFISDVTSNIIHAETTFDVNVIVENMGDDANLLQASATSITNASPNRGAFITVTLPSVDDSNNDVTGDIGSSSNGTTVTIPISASEVDLRFVSTDVTNPTNYNTVVTGSIGGTSIDWTYTGIDPVVIVDVVDVSNLSKNWTINILNENPNVVVDVKRYYDDGGEVLISPDNGSSGNIFIGNNFDTSTAIPSTVAEWFNVVVTVSHNGTVYERIESTIGK